MNIEGYFHIQIALQRSFESLANLGVEGIVFTRYRPQLDENNTRNKQLHLRPGQPDVSVEVSPNISEVRKVEESKGQVRSVGIEVFASQEERIQYRTNLVYLDITIAIPSASDDAWMLAKRFSSYFPSINKYVYEPDEKRRRGFEEFQSLCNIKPSDYQITESEIHPSIVKAIEGYGVEEISVDEENSRVTYARRQFRMSLQFT